MKFPKWFLVGLCAFVVFVLSCELVSRAEVDTGTPSPAVAVPDVCELALDQCSQDLVDCQIQQRSLEMVMMRMRLMMRMSPMMMEATMADRVSMREVEMCPGFAAFMETCRGE
jgi:hypothetical protein